MLLRNEGFRAGSRLHHPFQATRLSTLETRGFPSPPYGWVWLCQKKGIQQDALSPKHLDTWTVIRLRNAPGEAGFHLEAIAAIFMVSLRREQTTFAVQRIYQLITVRDS